MGWFCADAIAAASYGRMQLMGEPMGRVSGVLAGILMQKDLIAIDI